MDEKKLRIGFMFQATKNKEQIDSNVQYLLVFPFSILNLIN